MLPLRRGGVGRGEVDQDSPFPIFVWPSSDAGFLACTPHPDGLHLTVTRARQVGWGKGGVRWIKIQLLLFWLGQALTPIS